METTKSTTKTISMLLAISVLFASCASTTMIQSNPSGAKVYLNGESVGRTPYSHTDTKIIGSSTAVKIEKEGYAPFNTTITRDEAVDVGAVIGGFFFLVPFLWTMKYKPARTYELIPGLQNENNSAITQIKQNSIELKAKRLRELKQLLDEKVITQEEFEKEKKKILEEKEN